MASTRAAEKQAWKKLSTAQKQTRLRAKATTAELQLKRLLDDDVRTAGKYVHQASVAGYFPDFAFAHCRLIVELDGACHAGRAARRKDSRRSVRLRAAGWRVLRFWNSELREPTKLMKAILAATRDS